VEIRKQNHQFTQHTAMQGFLLLSDCASTSQPRSNLTWYTFCHRVEVHGCEVAVHQQLPLGPEASQSPPGAEQGISEHQQPRIGSKLVLILHLLLLLLHLLLLVLLLLPCQVGCCWVGNKDRGHQAASCCELEGEVCVLGGGGGEVMVRAAMGARLWGCLLSLVTWGSTDQQK